MTALHANRHDLAFQNGGEEYFNLSINAFLHRDKIERAFALDWQGSLQMEMGAVFSVLP